MPGLNGHANGSVSPPLEQGARKWRISIIGSGNWGSAVSKLIGENVQKHKDLFEQDVRMWTYEEDVDGRKLSELFNEKHENVKYLPGVKIPENVVAVPDLEEAVKDANAFVVVLPHQFIKSVCAGMKGKIAPDSKAISLVKGVAVHGDHVDIFAHMIERELGASCSALSGANIANEIAQGAFSETTIGYSVEDDGKLWQALFHTPRFRVQLVNDVTGVSLCGALKNIVAVAAGVVDGLDWGNNSKAAVMRIGLMEMRTFCQEFFPGTKNETFVHESAGVADLITSCLGGRNRKCAEAFVRTGKPFAKLEDEMLGGQKLQGVQTAQEIHEFLVQRERVDAFPLFNFVYRIAFDGLDPHTLVDCI